MKYLIAIVFVLMLLVSSVAAEPLKLDLVLFGDVPFAWSTGPADVRTLWAAGIRLEASKWILWDGASVNLQYTTGGVSVDETKGLCNWWYLDRCLSHYFRRFQDADNFQQLSIGFTQRVNLLGK